MFQLHILLFFISTIAFPAKIVETDTTFISREVTNNYYHAVYIEKNRKSKDYKNLLNFKMAKWDADGYKENLTYLKKHEAIKTKVLVNLAKEWMPLYKYKGKYYIYSPSEWGNIDRRILTDSTLIYWSMESPTPAPFQVVKKINQHTYFIQSKAFYLDEKPFSKLTIHIIDVKKNITIWESTLSNGSKHYGLYVARQNAANFDMIVNYCNEHKVMEFQFDQIDYLALLKGR
jgi:uncharacterized protein (UPF0333 family)